MRVLLSVLYLLIGIHTASYGVTQFRDKQTKGAFGTFLLLFITLGVLILTFCIGHS